MIFNPTNSVISRKITLPLYYTGITSKALLKHKGSEPGKIYALERDYSITVELTMKPMTITWYLIQSADKLISDTTTAYINSNIYI